MKQKVLILDGSFAVKPLHDALTKKYDVFTIGNDAKSYFALKAPAKHYLIDYSNLSEIKKHITLNDFFEIIPGCTDISLNTFSSINRNFRQIVNDTITKKNFSDFCKHCGVKTPEIIENPGSKDLPIIVKPNDSFSGKGVSIVRTLPDLERAIKYASCNSETNSYVCQKYIAGSLNSFSAFRCGSEIIIVNVHEENREGTFGVATSYCFDPDTQLKTKLHEIAHNFLYNRVKKLDYIHVQYILHENNPYPIELFLRCPGDIYPYLINLSTGIDYATLYCNGYLKEPLFIDQSINHPKLITRKTLFAKNREEAVEQLNNYAEKEIFLTIDIDKEFNSNDFVRFAVAFKHADSGKNE